MQSLVAKLGFAVITLVRLIALGIMIIAGILLIVLYRKHQAGKEVIHEMASICSHVRILSAVSGAEARVNERQKSNK